LPGSEDDVVLKGTVLPSAFEQLAFDEEHWLVAVIGEDKRVDDRVSCALGDLDLRRRAGDEAGGGQGVGPGGKGGDSAKLRASAYMQDREGYAHVPPDSSGPLTGIAQVRGRRLGWAAGSDPYGARQLPRPSSMLSLFSKGRTPLPVMVCALV
jgi:hypothetical protein